jgi:hypothetical protein
MSLSIEISSGQEILAIGGVGLYIESSKGTSRWLDFKLGTMSEQGWTMSG